MTAAEVFISLHSVDASLDGVPLRKVMACLDPCMKEDMRHAFPPEAMAVALQQLVTRYCPHSSRVFIKPQDGFLSPAGGCGGQRDPPVAVTTKADLLGSASS